MIPKYWIDSRKVIRNLGEDLITPIARFSKILSSLPESWKCLCKSCRRTCHFSPCLCRIEHSPVTLLFCSFHLFAEYGEFRAGADLSSVQGLLHHSSATTMPTQCLPQMCQGICYGWTIPWKQCQITNWIIQWNLEQSSKWESTKHTTKEQSRNQPKEYKSGWICDVFAGGESKVSTGVAETTECHTN